MKSPRHSVLLKKSIRRYKDVVLENPKIPLTSSPHSCIIFKKKHSDDKSWDGFEADFKNVPKHQQMNKKIKRIVIREGLVIIGFGLVLLVGAKIALTDMQVSLSMSPLGAALFSIGIYGYPIYLIIRFTIWAIKRLKEK